MPYKSRRYCCHPGCPALVNAGERYCPAHKKEQRGDNSHYDRRWQRLRLSILTKSPLCAICREHGRLTPATELHHIKALAGGGGDSLENLLPLCKPCHSKITWEASHGG